MNEDSTREALQVTKSTRDRDTLRTDLQRWLATRLGDAANVEITSFEAPESNGMSSETILFDAIWTEGGERASHRLVMRLAPPDDAFPVFETYDLTTQFHTMRLIAEHTDIPVPEVLWDEPSSDALGAPFFVMRRVDGDVPPDNQPYTFGSWVTEATDDERATLVRSSIEVLAKLREIADPTDTFSLLASSIPGDASPLRKHVAAAKRWLDWSTDGEGSPLIEQCFEWLEEHWPANESPTVVSWGDSRIGNTMYRDFRPVAVLDWEMASLAPAEIDLAWFIFLHRFFDDITTMMGMEGMPTFIERNAVERMYAEISGYEPQDMDWYLMYAATRHGIVFTRTGRWAVHFGEQEMPADPDDLIMHAPTLRAMLAGTYWASIA